MKFPFLASVVIFMVVLHHNLRKGKKIGKRQEDSFWKKEYEANTTRKQPLDDLQFITFSASEYIPVHLLSPHEVSDFFASFPQLKEILPSLLNLSEAKIVNLTDYTNTDLKLKYGVANFNLLSEYDENYLSLISYLHQYGQCYYEAGFYEQALTIFSYAISIGSDSTETFILSLKCCNTLGKDEQFREIIEKAKLLSSHRKNIIFRKLKESGLYND